MATIKVTSTTGVDFDDYALPDSGTATKVTHTATKWHLDYAPGQFDEYVGKTFSYTGNDLDTGTITGFTFSESKTEKFQVSGISVPAADLANAATPADFLAEALAGNDTITGGKGGDHLLGFAGNDTIDGGVGADAMEGGDGNDSYVIDNVGDTVTEDPGQGTDTVKTAIAITDAFDNIENYTFTGKGAWTFAGNDLGNQIIGGAGVDDLLGGASGDLLAGGKGNDTLEGGGGGDVLDGGAGNDTYVFNVGDGSDALFPGTYNTGDVIKLAGTDFYDLNLNWERDEIYLAGAVDGDYDYADTGKLVLWDFLGGKGSVTVTVDTLYNDGYGTDPALSTFTIQRGLTGTNNVNTSEIIIGTEGNDKINGKGGYYDGLYGGEGNDVITGGNATLGVGGFDWLRGDEGNDTLNGLGSDDNLRGGSGFDVLNGGDGIDTADLRGFGSQEPFQSGWADLSINRVIDDGTGGGDVLSSIENLRGTDLGDNLVGDAENNLIRSQGGNDTLTGAGGDDELQGENGDDTFRFNSFNEGNDVITDFDGTAEKLSFAASLDTGNDGILNDLTTAIASVVDNGVGNDVVVTFKAGGTITFQGAGDGTINQITDLVANNKQFTTFEDKYVLGGVNPDDVTGGDGNDILIAGAGNDGITGGEGDDAIDGGTGNDTYFFNIGDGFDILMPGTTNTGDVIQLAGTFYDLNFDWNGTNLIVAGAIDDKYDYNDTGNMTLQNFFGGKGSITVQLDATVNNTFYGDDLNLSTITFQQGLTGTNNIHSGEVIIGTAGNDKINGKGGYYDGIYGGDGNDSITGGSGVEWMRGGNGNDTLTGFAGDDNLRGEMGFDTVLGGDGVDRADYKTANHGAWVDLSIGRAIDDGYQTFDFNVIGSGDTLTGIENVRGSSFDDILTGDANANKLEGTDGDDTLTGGGGNDTLIGGDGADTFNFNALGEGNDEIEDFDVANDVLSFAKSLDKGAAGMLDDLSAAIQSVVDTGVNGDVVVTFNNGSVVTFDGIGDGTINNLNNLKNAVTITTFDDVHLIGDKNVNTLTGTDGNDIIIGLAGNDTIEGGQGNDALDGGVGNDTFVFNLNDGFDTLAPGTYNKGDIIELAGSNFYDLNFSWDGNRTLSIAQAIDGDFDFKDTGAIALQNFAGVGGKGSVTVHIDVVDNTLYGTDTDISTVTFQQALTGTKNATTTEVLIGTDGDDKINGNGGYYDMLFGDGGDDVINGGAGRDLIWGQWDNDTLNGAAGDDIIRASQGSDIINGGDGVDKAEYKDGDNGVIVDLGNGLTSNDGFGTQDKLTGIENVSGSTHDDQIFGDGGANALQGLDGDDTLRGAGGADTVEGGDGADTFQFSGFGEGNDTIVDFDKTSDNLAFADILDTGNNGILDDLQAAIANVSDDGTDVVVTFDSGATLTFLDVGTGTVNDITDLVTTNAQIQSY